MKRRIAKCLALCLLVAGCSSSDTPAPEAKADAQSAPVDSGAAPDSGSAPDAGPPPDASPDVADAAPVVDAADAADAVADAAPDIIDAADAAGDTDADVAPLPMCDPPVPPPEALWKAGAHGDGHVIPGGRALSPVGVSAKVGGFPVQVLVHPTLPVAYVNNTGKKHKSVQVVSSASGEVLADLERDESFYGMQLDPAGATLYVSGGRSKLVERYGIGEAGLLEKTGEVFIEGYPAGLALSPDGEHLWVGLFTGEAVAQVATATMEVLATIPVPFGVYGLVAVPGREELYVTGFADSRIAAVDLVTGVAHDFEVGGNPLGLAVSADGTRVYAAVCDGDVVVAVDTLTRELVGSAPVGEASFIDEAGQPLPASSPSDLLLDPVRNRLYLTRSADNAVSVLDPDTLATLGALPVEWYPTGLALTPDSGSLLVCNAKGISVGPSDLALANPPDADDAMAGTLSVIALDGLDIVALAKEVEANVRRPTSVYPFPCEGTFPVPPVRGRASPIEHVVLIVRENKTYDAVLGDLETGDGDPELVLFGEGVTPNLHALARRFANHDNFYNDSENSVQGHLWLTASFVNEYMERVRLEGGSTFDIASATEPGQPKYGTFFTHLIEHDVSFVNFGEVVGSFGEANGKSVVEFTDLGYPGLFFNMSVKDETKARYIVSRLVEDGDFPSFVFISLPNDHTYGTDPGTLSPESMINDNDYATGIIVDAISHSPYWDKTAIFILEDDPQQGLDHVEGHRSFCVVASPWAKRGHTSSVHTSFPSLFRTFELILDLPPMNRYDATATPFWDAFASTPDLEPYTAIPRTVEDTTNPISDDLAATWSKRMDWTGPDRNPDLGAVLWHHVKGAPPPGSHLQRAMAGQVPAEPRPVEDEDDADAYDEAWRMARVWLRAHPDVLARIPPDTLPLALRELATPGVK